MVISSNLEVNNLGVDDIRCVENGKDCGRLSRKGIAKCLRFDAYKINVNPNVPIEYSTTNMHA